MVKRQLMSTFEPPKKFIPLISESVSRLTHVPIEPVKEKTIPIQAHQVKLTYPNGMVLQLDSECDLEILWTLRTPKYQLSVYHHLSQPLILVLVYKTRRRRNFQIYINLLLDTETQLIKLVPDSLLDFGSLHKQKNHFMQLDRKHFENIFYIPL